MAAHRPRARRGPWALRARLDALLGAAPPDGVVAAGDGRAVRRVGLALAAGDNLAERCEREALDAVVLHRWWGAAAPAGVALLGYHDAFDAALGLHGALCAEALDARGRRPLDAKLAVVDSLDPSRLRECFGAEPAWVGAAGAAGRPPASGRVPAALASALDPERVRRAAAAGARLYVTGQWRPGAAEAVAATGLAVAVVGHATAEAWGLRELADRLAASAPELACVRLADGPRADGR